MLTADHAWDCAARVAGSFTVRGVVPRGSGRPRRDVLRPTRDGRARDGGARRRPRDEHAAPVEIAEVPLVRPMHYTSGTSGRPKGVRGGVLDGDAARARWSWTSERSGASHRTTCIWWPARCTTRRRCGRSAPCWPVGRCGCCPGGRSSGFGVETVWVPVDRVPARGPDHHWWRERAPGRGGAGALPGAGRARGGRVRGVRSRLGAAGVRDHPGRRPRLRDLPLRQGARRRLTDLFSPPSQ